MTLVRFPPNVPLMRNAIQSKSESDACIIYLMFLILFSSPPQAVIAGDEKRFKTIGGEIATGGLGKVQEKGMVMKDKKDLPFKQVSENSSFGYISIEALIAPTDTIGVYLDHMWLSKDGVKAPPGSNGAKRLGMTRICTIKGGETKTFKVSAGSHEIGVSDDVYGSEELSVEVSPEQTVKVICGNRFAGMKKAYYGIRYIFSRTIPGKNFYYMKKIENQDKAG